MNLQEFESLLKKHDWYYNYSDDHRYYTKGVAERNEIEAALAELTSLGFREEACRLYNELKPADFFERT